MTKHWKKDEEEAPITQRNLGLSIVFDRLVYEKIMHWVHKSPVEVSGLGSVVVDHETNTLRVVDAIMLKQENTATATDIDATAISKAMYEHFRLAKPGELKFWWHSHVNMGVFWSGTDIATIEQLGGQGWFAATVFNKKNEVKSAFIQSKNSGPVRIFLEDIPTKVMQNSNAEIRALWDKEYDDNVVEKKYTSYVGGGNYSRSFLGEDDEGAEARSAQWKEMARKWAKERSGSKDDSKDEEEAQEAKDFGFKSLESYRKAKKEMEDAKEMEMDLDTYRQFIKDNPEWTDEELVTVYTGEAEEEQVAVNKQPVKKKVYTESDEASMGQHEISEYIAAQQKREEEEKQFQPSVSEVEAWLKDKD